MKRGTPRHPKMDHFCELLHAEFPRMPKDAILPMAVGMLELLWHFTAQYTPQGDIGRYDDARIEAAISWPGARGRALNLLTTAGWVDSDPVFRCVIHDWITHSDDSVRKRLQRGGLDFVKVTGEVTGQNQKMSATQPDKNCLPVPCQSLTPLPSASLCFEESPPPTAAELKNAIHQLAVASPQKANGKTDRAAIEKRLHDHEIARRWIAEYPLAAKLPGKPDDEIIQRAIEAAGDLECLCRSLREMASAGKTPDRSWAWFPTVLTQYRELHD